MVALRSTKLFSTLAVFDAHQSGHFVKITYPFSVDELSTQGFGDEVVIEKILHYTPNVFHVIIPGRGIYDVTKRMYRENSISIDWQTKIDGYEILVSEPPKPLEKPVVIGKT